MRIARDSAWVFVVLFVIVVMPSLVYVSLSASSMAAGIAVSCAAIVVAALGRMRLSGSFLKFSILLFILAFLVHTAYFFVQGGFSVKHALSVLLLAFMFFCAALFAVKIESVHGADLIVILYVLSIFIIMLGLVSLIIPVSFLNYHKYAKSIFPFSEPSHYAITVGGVLLATGYYLSFWWRAGLLLSVLFLSLAYPSTLLLLLALIMLVSYYVRNFLSFGFIVLLVVALFFLVFYFGVDVSYYEDRLRFSESTSNLTALVYMQGWDDSYRALLQTDLVGLGFQNMGALEPGVYGEKIFQIVGVYKNREDGGFLAAKIISEFGGLGLVFLLFYIGGVCSSLMYNRKFLRAYRLDCDKSLDLYPVSTVLGSSLIIAFSIEVFARGYGYFSPGILLAMVSIFLVSKKRMRHI